MRLCVRMAALAAMLVGVAAGLIHLRAETVRAGHRLHGLNARKRTLEKDFGRLEVAIARLSSQDRLREYATDLDRPAEGPPAPAAAARTASAPAAVPAKASPAPSAPRAPTVVAQRTPRAAPRSERPRG